MALVNHLIKIEESEAANNATIKSPKNGITPINIAPILSLVMTPYIIGNIGRIKIRKISIVPRRAGEP